MEQDEDLTLPTTFATRRGVERIPSETMSVVAQAGGWIAAVAVIAQLVSTTDAVALAANRNPSTENAGAVAVVETAGATMTHAAKPATPPMR